jgi:hypothetical protein
LVRGRDAVRYGAKIQVTGLLARRAPKFKLVVPAGNSCPDRRIELGLRLVGDTGVPSATTRLAPTTTLGRSLGVFCRSLRD